MYYISVYCGETNNPLTHFSFIVPSPFVCPYRNQYPPVCTLLSYCPQTLCMSIIETKNPLYAHFSTIVSRPFACPYYIFCKTGMALLHITEYLFTRVFVVKGRAVDGRNIYYIPFVYLMRVASLRYRNQEPRVCRLLYVSKGLTIPDHPLELTTP